MKKPLLLSTLLVLSILSLNAQPVKSLFQQKPQLSRDFHSIAGKYEAFQLDKQALADLRNQSLQDLDIQLPFENQLMKLKLHKTTITANNFSVIEALPGGERKTVNYSGATFYQGTIEGKLRSIATISIFNNQVMGVIADEKSNIILGAIENKGIATDEYALYRDQDLRITDPFNCATSDTPVGDVVAVPNNIPVAGRGESVGEPVDIYFECDYKFYQDKGSNTNNVINYVLGFFNNTALLYANENIKMQVSQILVWTTQDPEAAAGANTTSDVLTSFSNRMSTATYIGDYAHFLSTRSLGGGIAYIPGNPCSSGKKFRTGVSAINNSYNDYPTYSWTVEVVTHELGHNLGSNHTHWCGWVGGALDNCYTTEGGCVAGPAPTNGGTIMSYCHLTSYGINLSNGFGQQPGDKIRSVVAAATCFGNCKMTIAISKVDASCSQNNGTATVVATNGTGALTYTWSNGQTAASLVNVGPGTYNVTVNDAGGCQVLGVTTIVNTGGTLNATINPSTASSICSGGSILLTATNNVAYTYQWYKDAVLISGATANTYTATATGNYSVMIVSGACSVSKSVSITQVATPSAAITAGGPTTFCTGGAVVLDGNAGTGYTYQWYNNGTAISGATNTTYTATATGSYTVKVSAGSCQSNSSALSVTVNAVPTATITAGGALTFCSGGNVMLNANTGTGLSYQWYNNNIAIGGATSSSYSANANGSYTVKVTANGCSTTSSAIVVSVVTPPSAVIIAGSATTFCSGGQVTLNASVGTGYTYQWYNGGTVINGATGASYDATTTGNYTVRVSAGSCQTLSAATTVTVNPTPSASITASGATTFCIGSSVVLNANTGNGFIYLWYNNGTAISAATSAAYTATATGSYSVKVTSGTCSNTSAATSVVASPTPTASISASGSTTICSGNHVTLSSSTGTGYTYQWYNSAVAISGATNVSYDAVSNGSYTVKVSLGSCQATSAATIVTVNPTPTASVTAGGATSFCTGSSVTLNANTGSGFTYQWYNNGTAIGTATGAAYIATATGSYSVKVTSGTCSNTSAATNVVAGPTPTASITASGSTTICSGNQVTLSTSTGAGYTYQWYNSAVAISGATNPSYDAISNGNYTVKVSLGTCQATSAATLVTVNPTPTATITAGGATSFCTGGSVTLNANTGSGFTYQWYNNGTAIGAATSAAYTATATGSYSVKVTSGTCSNTSAATNVVASPTPTASISASGSTTICSGNHVTLSTSTGTGYTYQWYNSAAAISGATNASYDAVSNGSYTVKVSLGTCQATSAATIVTVNPVPTASITAGGATSFCSGGSVTLNANTGSGLTYQWYNNATAIAGATNASYSASANGSYTVRMTAAGCSANSAGISVTVNPIPQAVITPAGPTAFCTEGSVDLNASTGTGYSYQWYNNGIVINTATNPSYHALNEGDYTVKVTAGSCQATSLPVTVTVSPGPDAQITTGGPTSFCMGGNLVLHGNTGAGYLYHWFQNGVAIPGATGPDYTAQASGTYSVTIDLGTCSSTSPDQVITVLPVPSITVTPATSTIQKFQTQTLTGSGAVSYNWSVQPSLVNAAVNSAILRPLSTTNYLIEGTGTNGCKGIATATINVIGCGDATDLHATTSSPARAVLSWTNPIEATSDTLEYRKLGTTTWTKLFVTGNEYELNGLEPNTNYEYSVIPLCSAVPGYIPSASMTFKTEPLITGIYIQLYPNPVSTTAKLEIIMDHPFSFQAYLYNNFGVFQRMISAPANYPAGQVMKTINTSGMKSGIYNLLVIINGKRYNLKMVVVH